jgi:hypothetical protein
VTSSGDTAALSRHPGDRIIGFGVEVWGRDPVIDGR